MSSNADNRLTELMKRFPCLAGLPVDRSCWFEQPGAWLSAPAKTVLFDAGAACMIFPLLIDGEIQVVRNTRSGREIELYRVHPGEPCLVSTSCILGTSVYPARGIAVTPVRLAALSAVQIETLLTEHLPFRRFIFNAFTHRMSTLMEKVEQVAFVRLEQRLAHLLATTPSPFHGTHQEVADQLGASREVISRLLKAFERSGWIELGRREIIIQRPAALDRLASPSDHSGL
jgi:CRP/FNR family transcriptional regulator, anaerobic regulatory protein